MAQCCSQLGGASGRDGGSNPRRGKVASIRQPLYRKHALHDIYKSPTSGQASIRDAGSSAGLESMK